MKATELRIGNWVKYKASKKVKPERRGIDVQVSADDLMFLQEGYYCPITPIPLTEEWLKRFGFGVHKYPSTSRGKTLYFKVCFPRNVKIDVVISLNDKYLRHIKHVHQLMNLFHSLTGAELVLKE